MAEAEMARRAPRQLTEMRDVYDLLEEVRLRPGMWVRGSSLQHLSSMLFGYHVALKVHGAEELLDFRQGGPFTDWLWPRLGYEYESSLGWAVEIERMAEATNRPAIELFFELLDEFRAEQGMPGPSWGDPGSGRAERITHPG
ncbi:hypothetical protein OG252_02335 [Streptomyces sp. NBC_01352]|uniref:hypothetical protein n=1 Tax=Streptomyces sp. NBC_01352 TaxID=2903834 RepID=UPI002E301DB8|nr:hypothetical protein [Streptomyces sp. NBC_01352]